MARLIVGITGASGTVYGIELLKMLADAGVETHLVPLVAMVRETPSHLGQMN